MKEHLQVELYCGSEAIADAASLILKALEDGSFKIQWVEMKLEACL